MVKQYMRQCSLSGELPFGNQHAPVYPALGPAAAILTMLASNFMSIGPQVTLFMFICWTKVLSGLRMLVYIHTLGAKSQWWRGVLY